MKIFVKSLIALGLIHSAYANVSGCPDVQQVQQLELTHAVWYRHPDIEIEGGLYQVFGQLKTSEKAWVSYTGFFKAEGRSSAIYFVREGLKNQSIQFMAEENNQCKYQIEVNFPWGFRSINLTLK